MINFWILNKNFMQNMASKTNLVCLNIVIKEVFSWLKIKIVTIWQCFTIFNKKFIVLNLIIARKGLTVCYHF